jgi:hypothetical protein
MASKSHRFYRGVIRDDADGDLGGGGRLARRAAFDGARRRLARRPVPGANRVTGGDQVRGHGAAHLAEAAERDDHQCFPNSALSLLPTPLARNVR